MEILLLLVLGGLAAWWFLARDTSDKSKTSAANAAYKVEQPAAAPAWHTAPPEGTKPLPIPNPLDINNDGKVNLDDVKEAVKKTKARVKKAADVNGDGRVSKADVAAAGKKVKAKAAAKKPARAKKS